MFNQIKTIMINLSKLKTLFTITLFSIAFNACKKHEQDVITPQLSYYKPKLMKDSSNVLLHQYEFDQKDRLTFINGWIPNVNNPFLYLKTRFNFIGNTCYEIDSAYFKQLNTWFISAPDTFNFDNNGRLITGKNWTEYSHQLFNKDTTNRLFRFTNLNYRESSDTNIIVKNVKTNIYKDSTYSVTFKICKNKAIILLPNSKKVIIDNSVATNTKLPNPIINSFEDYICGQFESPEFNYLPLHVSIYTNNILTEEYNYTWDFDILNRPIRYTQINAVNNKTVKRYIYEY